MLIKAVELNGQSTSGYPKLAALYGSTLPDMRGRFARGFGGNSGALNAVQGEEIKSHSHSASFTGNALPSHSHTYTASTNNTDDEGVGSDSAADNQWSSYTTNSVSAGTPTGSVTVNASSGSKVRPTNVAMLFIIKAE